MAAPWISWGLAKTRASTALTTACFLVYNDEPICFITSYRLIRLRNSFCSFRYRVTRDWQASIRCCLCFVGQLLWEPSDTLENFRHTRGWLSLQNQQSGSIRSLFHEPWNVYQRECRFQLGWRSGPLLPYAPLQHEHHHRQTDDRCKANTLERNKVSLLNTADYDKFQHLLLLLLLEILRLFSALAEHQHQLFTSE